MEFFRIYQRILHHKKWWNGILRASLKDDVAAGSDVKCSLRVFITAGGRLSLLRERSVNQFERERGHVIVQRRTQFEDI